MFLSCSSFFHQLLGCSSTDQVFRWKVLKIVHCLFLTLHCRGLCPQYSDGQSFHVFTTRQRNMLPWYIVHGYFVLKVFMPLSLVLKEPFRGRVYRLIPYKMKKWIYQQIRMNFYEYFMLYYIKSMPLTCFSHTCSRPQGGKLQRI